MSKITIDWKFEREIADCSVDEQVYFSAWHREDPTITFTEMLQSCAEARREREEEEWKRYQEDQAFYAEEEARLLAEEEARLLAEEPCSRCGRGELGGCEDCYKADEEAFKASCIWCNTLDANEPCGVCDHPIYKCSICQKEASDIICESCAD